MRERMGAGGGRRIGIGWVTLLGLDEILYGVDCFSPLESSRRPRDWRWWRFVGGAQVWNDEGRGREKERKKEKSGTRTNIRTRTRAVFDLRKWKAAGRIGHGEGEDGSWIEICRGLRRGVKKKGKKSEIARSSMGLNGLIFLRSFNSDYTLSEVVIDRVLKAASLRCKKCPQGEREREKEGERERRREKIGEKDDEARCKCLERDAPWPFPLGISRYRFEIAPIFPSLLLSQIPNEYLANEFLR